MNILFLTNATYPLWRSHLKYLFEEELAKKDVQIYWVLVGSKDQKSVESFSINNNHYFLLPESTSFAGSKFFFGTDFKYKSDIIKKILKEKNIDIVQVSDNLTYSLIAHHLKNEFKFKLSIYYTSSYPLFAKERLLRNFNNSNLFNYLNEKIKDLLLREIILKSDFFQGITNDLMLLYPSAKSNFSLPMCSHDVIPIKGESQSKKKFKLIYTGAIAQIRRLEFLIRTIYIVKKNGYRDIELKIVGPSKDRYRESLYSLICALNLKNEISIIESVPYNQMLRLISNSNMGVSFLPPTKNFIISSPTKVIEYLSMKIPVLINKEIIDQEKIVKSSNSGISVEYDERKAAIAIIYAIKNKSKLSKLGTDGYNWVKSERNYKDLAINLHKEYVKCLENNES